MTNRLSSESSPYLLQHANNPVEWYPWGEEALNAAKERDLPILLSVGYSSCHWCHVMEKESFENNNIAKQMNENFINIKVDREERPDIDEIYMSAVQSMTGQGGWPLTVFLTPECRPFFGGTYFPPVSRGGHVGFPQLLNAVTDAFNNRRDQLETSSVHIVEHIQKLNDSSGEKLAELKMEDLDNAFEAIATQFDWELGGFGSNIKFPHALALEFLMVYYYSNPDSSALDMVEIALKKMYEGGIYDHIGSGFHRYSTDKEWLVPHFEKMLYDNALLSRLYVHAYQATGNDFYMDVAKDIFGFIEREMTSEDGLFYSAQDADSEGEEGTFYTWSLEELRDLLGSDYEDSFFEKIGVTQRGNFEGRNIIHLPHGVSTYQEIWEDTESKPSPKSIILEKRDSRVRPFKDEKAIVFWNSLMTQSICEGYFATGDNTYKIRAIQNIKTLLKLEADYGRLPRLKINDSIIGSGFLEDYAALAMACISVYEITFEQTWLNEAKRLQNNLVQMFWDDKTSRFYDVSAREDQLVVRPSTEYDNVTPSGASMALALLIKMQNLTGDNKYYDIIISILHNNTALKLEHSLSFGYFLSSLHMFLERPVEIALIATKESDFHQFTKMIGKRFLPTRVFAGKVSGESLQVDSPPLLLDRGLVNNMTTAYLCEGNVCQLPVNTAGALSTQIEKFVPEI